MKVITSFNRGAAHGMERCPAVGFCQGVSIEMGKEPMPQKARIWLYMLGGLGGVIVIFTVVANDINSRTSVVGYFVGFVCMLLAAMAAFSTRDDEKRGNKKDQDGRS